MKLHILIVNINNLELTRNLVEDLFRQTCPFKLTLIDQNSSEEGTKEYLLSLAIENVEVIINDTIADLNRLWNRFYQKSKEPYLCFLNNDVRVPSNFVEDIVAILDKEQEVGCVVHATNHLNYRKTTPLNYIIMPYQICQGWCFTLRKEAYTMIPDEIRVFGGDDFLFTNVYRKGWKVATCLSSPIIHFKAKSRKYCIVNLQEDTVNYMKFGHERLPHLTRYTKRYPQFLTIEEDKNDLCR